MVGTLVEELFLRFPYEFYFYGTIMHKDFSKNVQSESFGRFFLILDDPEDIANLYCNFAYPYREGCVICSIHLR